jgi:hypothetical protein
VLFVALFLFFHGFDFICFFLALFLFVSLDGVLVRTFAFFSFLDFLFLFPDPLAILLIRVANSRFRSHQHPSVTRLGRPGHSGSILNNRPGAVRSRYCLSNPRCAANFCEIQCFAQKPTSSIFIVERTQSGHQLCSWNPQ